MSRLWFIVTFLLLTGAPWSFAEDASSQKPPSMLQQMLRENSSLPKTSVPSSSISAPPQNLPQGRGKADLLKMYMQQGGDISGGGFGLRFKNSDGILFFDLWCENHLYQFSPLDSAKPNGLVPSTLTKRELVLGWPLDLKRVAPQELALAQERVRAWHSAAPQLTQKILAELQSTDIWHGIFLLPNDNPNDQFEFPGTPAQLAEFHKKYQEIQVAKVNRFSGHIFIASGLWDRMDLKSRAALLVHESLRRIYLQTNKGYLRPSILQWMTGAMMFRNPGSSPADVRMIDSFYDEMFQNTDNTVEEEKHRPPHWRDTLCTERETLVQQFKAQVEPRLSFSNLSAQQTRDVLCELHSKASQMDQQGPQWIPLNSFHHVPFACNFATLADMPTYTLNYWLQKSLSVGLHWQDSSTEKIFPRDLPYLLKQEPSMLNPASFSEVVDRFERLGTHYCATRKDYYGEGAEFVSTADVLLEGITYLLMPQEDVAFLNAFKDPHTTESDISDVYRGRVLDAFEEAVRSVGGAEPTQSRKNSK